MKKHGRVIYLILALLLFPALAQASSTNELFTRTTLLLIALITLANWCGFLFERFGLPELVGQIFAGMLLGNVALLVFDFNIGELYRSNEFLQYSSELAVVLLLFLVGLESNMGDLVRVGPNATRVAVVGVALPVVLGLGTWKLLGFTADIEGWFVGAMLAATSVGITAKMLDSAGVIHTPSAEVILGAAVIDDVLGVMLLAILASVLVTGSFSAVELVWIVVKALAFFLVAIFLGQRLMPHVIRITALNNNAAFWTGFSLCMALIAAQIAAFAGLAPLIGAFVAGLLLDDVHFADDHKFRKEHIEDLLRPITSIMLTIFFVGIGAQVDFTTFLEPKSLLLIAVLLVVAIVSKTASGFTVRGPGFERLGIGLGMIPRGEVGLVFASFAYQHEVFCCKDYSALVMVVLLTTIVGPIVLKRRLPHFR